MAFRATERLPATKGTTGLEEDLDLSAVGVFEADLLVIKRSILSCLDTLFFGDAFSWEFDLDLSDLKLDFDSGAFFCSDFDSTDFALVATEAFSEEFLVTSTFLFFFGLGKPVLFALRLFLDLK